MAGVLKWDNTNDRVRFTTLAAALQNIPTGAYTMAFLAKRNGISNFDALGYLLSGSDPGTVQAGASFEATNNQLLMDLSGAPKWVNNFTSTASPYMLVITKTAGTTIPNLWWKLGSGGSWTNEGAANNSQANGSAATFGLEIGAWENGDFYNGWIGLIGIWSNVMSDTNIQALDDNWRTSDW